jgi:hypothetical protein
MRTPLLPIRRLSRRLTAMIAACAAIAFGVTAYGLTAASAAPRAPHYSGTFTFKLIASPGIAKCLPKARGQVWITPHALNDTMKVQLWGMPAGSDFDLFVIQTPNKPFGVSWYQSDIDVNKSGTGAATVQGIFDKETFSVSPGGTTTFKPTHQFHIGVWFNDPKLPFKLGCEAGLKAPAVTPFNGEQHAGIQVVNSANFPAKAGPLSKVKR